MPLEVKDAARLWDMLDAARAIEEFVRGRTFEEYLSNRMMRGAVERNLEIIGEAARHVSGKARNMFADIPWTSVIGLRNIIAHEYGEIRHEKVWGICRDRLPALIEQLERSGVDHAPPGEDG
ncbi:DUF86 domain-containing protein [bacterium]|nr:DUF86 domain-containing protein [bacterium]